MNDISEINERYKYFPIDSCGKLLIKELKYIRKA